MPSSAPRPCREPNCRALVRDGSAYCDKHKRVARGSFADRERGTRQQRGYGAGWEAKRQRVFARDKWLCQECLRAGVIKPVGDTPYSAWCDHIVAKAEGGTDDDTNLQTLCRSCHAAKTDAEKQRGRSRAAQGLLTKQATPGR
ncbi:HNH endonuclease [Pandoraea pneumonica]|uniref:HNH endonuclease n=1 Tax=Pandoraea pneumonica TaxID=2508299 RepID=UPI001241CFAC|nr:HNH endonuclease [Pandoraea pneumonica]